eukprot:TRINITY_DN10504_c0_g2_i1.p1 TRINITY_DN10504_c0_g2~~TRINITY_DN10504_c0_g2_i1.p1  ORF type:complete len:322 (-),score=121.87 TRINITY_DN10504_c0_g2_i1:358-1323(-)
MTAAISVWLCILAASPAALTLLSGFPLWFKTNFFVHRYSGFLFLFHYLTAWYFYNTDYAYYKDSVLPWSLPLNGVVQAVSAMYTFTFLSKRTDPGGFFGDRGTMSYSFVKENLFYQLLVLTGAFYYTDKGYLFATGTVLGQILETLFTFLPYVLLRPLFPKTHFREALGNNTRYSSEGNRGFYYYGVWVIKVFYVSIKHLGFLIMYIRFINGFDAADQELLLGWVLANAGTVSIAVFLSTLRFKKVMNPRLAYSTYVIMAYAPFYFLLRLAPTIWSHAQLLPVVIVSLVINFGPVYLQKGYQVLIMFAFHAYRQGLLPALV